MARPTGDFDASRYFRGAGDLAFYNVGTAAIRELARTIHAEHKAEWSIDEAMAFADALIEDRHLEAKSVGIELVARYRRDFTPGLLPRWKRWLAGNHSANWATTDSICGVLIGPLLLQHAELGARMRVWARDRNMWVRRASIVGLIPRARRGASLDLVYEIARRLHGDSEDLIQMRSVGRFARPAKPTCRASSATSAPTVRRSRGRRCATRSNGSPKRSVALFSRRRGPRTKNQEQGPG